MRVNPPSKIVKGLAEGTLRTTATHLEKGDVMLVMESSATSVGDLKAAPPVAPKRAFWVTVRIVGISAIVADDEKGDAHIILDMAPQTAVTIKDREIIEPDATVTVASVFDATPVAESATVAEMIGIVKSAHAAGVSDELWYALQDQAMLSDPELIESIAQMKSGDTVPACPDCVMPLSAGHVCPEFMLTARADHVATLSWGTRGRVKRCKSSRPRKLMRGKVAA